MDSFSQENSSFIASNTEIASMDFFQSAQQIRAATAPIRSLSELQQFKLSKKFLNLEQSVICSNQLLHKSYDKFDLETPYGHDICQKYLNHIQTLCQTYNVKTASRDYRSNFAQAYKILYKEGQLSYLTQILDSAQEGFSHLWVNGQKYPFSQEVLDHGSRLMIEFFKLQHCLRDIYAKITKQAVNINLDMIIVQVKENLYEFDLSWSTFQRIYVMELISIEQQARSLITKAIQLEKCLTSVQIRQKMKGKILINCQDYLSMRAKFCEVICQINQTANCYGKGRDDLDHSILCQTEGILRRITRQQSKAIRLLGQKIRSSFMNIRYLLRKYEKNIQMVDPQLKNNSDLVQVLVQYEKYWQKGGAYFCDSQKKKHLLHFSGIIEGITEKYQKFKEMIQCSDADIFLIIPCILMLKYLDRDDKFLCQYYLPALNQIDTKIFRTYFQLEKQFEEWKKDSMQHYSYYNILEKMIIGVELSEGQKKKIEMRKDLVDKILGKIKNLGNQLHRATPAEWNSFMEICLAGSAGQ